jgi:hypothetical protein
MLPALWPWSKAANIFFFFFSWSKAANMNENNVKILKYLLLHHSSFLWLLFHRPWRVANFFVLVF